MSLANLKVGDLVEAGPLLSPVTQEDVILMITKVSEDHHSVDYDVTYFGVFVGKGHATETDGSIDWRFGHGD